MKSKYFLPILLGSCSSCLFGQAGPQEIPAGATLEVTDQAEEFGVLFLAPGTGTLLYDNLGDGQQINTKGEPFAFQTETANAGTFALQGDNAVVVHGPTATGGAPLGLITLQDSSSVNFEGDVFTQAFTITSAAGSRTSDQNQQTAIFQGSTGLTTTTLNITPNVLANVTLEGSINAVTTNINNNGGVGTVTFSLYKGAAATFTGTTLNVNSGNIVNFQMPVIVPTININNIQANVNFQNNVNTQAAPGQLNFLLDGNVTLQTGATFFGDILGTSSGLGNLMLQNQAVVAGNAGIVGNPVSYVIAQPSSATNSTTTVQNTMDSINVWLQGVTKTSKNVTSLSNSTLINTNEWITNSIQNVTTYLGGALVSGSPNVYANAINANSVVYNGGVLVLSLDTSAITKNGTAYIVNTSSFSGALPLISTILSQPLSTGTLTIQTLANGSIVAVVENVQQDVSVAPVDNAVQTLYPPSFLHPESDIHFVLTELENLGIASPYKDILLQIDPTSGIMGTAQESFNTTKQFQKVWLEHLQRNRTNGLLLRKNCCNAYQDSCNDIKVWADGFGSYGRQSALGDFNGYVAKTVGTVLAVEKPLTICGLRAGVGFGYAHTDINNKGNPGNYTQINNCQATGYFTYDRSQWFLDGGFSLGWNNYKRSRRIVFASIDRKARANFWGQEYSGFLTTGYQCYADNLEITPLASLIYSHLHLDAHTERGANSLNLHLSSDHYNFWQSGLGIKLAYLFDSCYGAIIPEVHSLWLHNFNRNPVRVHASFSSVEFMDVKFKNKTPPFDQNLWNIGASLTCIRNEGFSLMAVYDYERSCHYFTHQGLVELAWQY